MEPSLSMFPVSGSVAKTAVAIVTLVYAWRFFDWVWLTPKKTEKRLRDQGLKGTSYTFLYGDINEIMKSTTESYVEPINLNDDIVPRVLSFAHRVVTTHGKNCFTWLGPTPLLHITNPSMIKEVLGNYQDFQKQRGGNPLARMLAKGLVDVEGDQWVKHRKIINPAFHVEKLKHMVPAFYESCAEMVNKWEAALKEDFTCEMDVWPHLQTLAADVISRTAFGSSYIEGRKIFELQREQAELVVIASRSFYIPGSRLYPPVVAIPRMIHKQTKLGSITLPAGTIMVLHTMLSHHDSDIWGKDVKEFKPERFSQGMSKVTKGQTAFIPFGGGPRVCIGQNFAMLEAKMALAMILRRFSFELSPSYSHAPYTIITLQPQFGAHLSLHKL
ncbi:hypothetical protein E3N88_17059 [Mikania micrantha]|uniref:Cytochrome P450 n=1 Tax=Mikania micrantha TaxID=192012 RepID=A0A5N6NSK3_9ASTR|nr:hypothetical protein E3N88_17059 [Mikania micrantha]